MSKLSNYYLLKQLLKEKQSKLDTLKYEYESIVKQEPYMQNRLKNRQYSMHRLAGEIESIKREIKAMENKHLQDSMNMMKLMNWTVDADCEKVYTKGESTEDQCKDDDATEMGAFEELGQNHETEAMEPEEHPVLAQDDEVGEKFKTVMEEFGKGELKSSSGEKVTDPKQAKAIAYSEQREAKDWSPITKDDEQWITMNGAHIKIGEGESKSSAVKKFLSNKKSGKSSGSEAGAAAKPEKKSESTAKKEVSKQKESSKSGSSPSKIGLEEHEINKIKNMSEEEIKEEYGSEYGAYVTEMTWKLKQSGQYPDTKEVDKIKDKMWYMRKEGKKDTPEYKDLEKKKNDWNKNFNAINKEIKTKAYEFSSPKEKERLDEVRSYFKKNPAPKWADSDPKVAEANKLINLSGGAM